MSNYVKEHKWYREYADKGYESIERADELAAFFACSRCLPSHCVALTRKRPTVDRKPVQEWKPDNNGEGPES